MLLAGMNVARINCAHGDAAQWESIALALRAAEQQVRIDGRASGALGLMGSRRDLAALALDVKGPEIRVGRFGDSVPAGRGGAQKEVPLAPGDRLTLTTDAREALTGSASRLFISYPALSAQAAPGQVIFVDDGNVELVVLAAECV
jgi:pyruvate kinase